MSRCRWTVADRCLAWTLDSIGFVAMITRQHEHSCSADVSAAAALFRSLADGTRLAIVHELARGERRIVGLTTAVELGA
jgi:hypothetical protein